VDEFLLNEEDDANKDKDELAKDVKEEEREINTRSITRRN